MGTNAYYLNQFISTTLATVGGIDDSQTTGIILTSVTGVETTKPGIVCLSYSDPIDTSKAEWISYTSISVTNELQGVTRGAEGFSAKSHSNGVTIAFPISESHINNLNDALIIGGSATNLATGVIDDDTFATASATKLATSESIKAYSDSGVQTLTNKTLTSPKLNENVALTSTSTELNALHGKMGNFTNTTSLSITATNGSITTASSSVYYVQIGKIVFLYGNISITNNGSGSGFLKLSLPVNADSICFVHGRDSYNGKMITGLVASNYIEFRRTIDDSYPAVNNSNIYFSGFYKST